MTDIRPDLEQTTDTRANTDDYALTRVPPEARHSWWTIAIQRFGQLSALSQFILGAALGFGMTFKNALIAIVLGAVILEIVAIFTGIIGQREGLSTSVIARWTGFGRYGSGFIGLIIALSLVGWFGVQSGVSAESLNLFIPAVPTWAWSLIFGLAVTLVVTYGFKSMAIVAYITVPAFLILAGWSIIDELRKHSISELATSLPPGPTLSIGAGATLVAGGFIVGMVTTPDMSRFNRSAKDVVKQTIIGVTIGEFMISLAGVLLAHALRTNSVVEIVTSSSGIVGTLVIIAGTLKINDWNLYSSTLAVVNFLETAFRIEAPRRTVTWVMGIAGSVFAALGILDHFIQFLTILGVVIPPVAGIMVVEYYVARTWRAALTKSAPGLPDSEPTLIVGTLVAWIAAALVGQYVSWGIASLNSLVTAMVLYFVFHKLGLLKPVSIVATRVAPTEPKVIA